MADIQQLLHERANELCEAMSSRQVIKEAFFITPFASENDVTVRPEPIQAAGCFLINGARLALASLRLRNAKSRLVSTYAKFDYGFVLGIPDAPFMASLILADELQE